MQRLKSWQLFAVCVLTWATTWHAITYQIAPISPELGVGVRFGLAGLLVVGACLWRGIRLPSALRDHAMLALQGVFLYGVSYVCVYYAERYVPSGLVAVGYSASPLITGIGASLLFGIRVGRRFVVGRPARARRGRADLLAGVREGEQREPCRPRRRCSPSHRCCCRRSAAWPPAATCRAACRSGRRSGSACCTARIACLLIALVRGQSFALPTHGHLVAHAGLPGAGRIDPDLRLLPDPAEPHRPRADRLDRRDDAAARAAGLDRVRELRAQPC